MTARQRFAELLQRSFGSGVRGYMVMQNASGRDLHDDKT
jgi:hypothetical protein